jgi:hypothetical protein
MHVQSLKYIQQKENKYCTCSEILPSLTRLENSITINGYHGVL